MTKNNPGQAKQDNTSGAVLVIGAGIGGMQSALDLAESGFLVHLISDEPSIGGTMSRLDKTFPTGDCAMCMISPRMVESSRHPNIKLHTLSEVTGIQGSPGAYQASVLQQARYVDSEKCTGCGLCEPECPTKVANLFNQGLDKRKAIYSLFPQAVPNTRAIDATKCLFLTRGVCRKCEKVCDAQAINFDDQDKNYTLSVGAVILAPGLKTYDPEIRQELGYGVHKNVITSLQFERLLSASGPCAGEVRRPSDNAHPKKLAWIQCVGSRNSHNANGWCSSVCCMYGAKQSIIAKEHDAEVDATIFYMELRAFGKDFDKYIDKAKNQHGVKYRRAMVSEVIEDRESGDLVLHYIDEDGQLIHETFDLVILSVGFEPHHKAKQLADTFQIEMDDNGFAKTSKLAPVDSTREGIFLAGSYQGPKDIPETAIQASGAASRAMSLLSKNRGKEIVEVILPPEKDITSEEPRLGVFVCHCGTNISGTVDVEKVADEIGHERDVNHTETIIYACSPDGQQKIKDIISEKKLNRVVVASCTPRTHATLFQDTIREVGLNKYLFELADIREQCSWCHRDNKEAATQKAIDIVRMNVAKTRLLSPIASDSIGVNHTALIIGGGISGMTAALSLAGQGYGVHLVEREPQLGGLLRNLQMNLEGDDIQSFLMETITKVEKEPNIFVHLQDNIEESDGFIGNFSTKLKSGAIIEHGAVLVANGGQEYIPHEYGYGSSDKIVTQRQLEQQLSTTAPDDKDCFVMIQCVGSREEPANYCSRICCQDALKNSIAIKQANPKTKVAILYRDIRSYGLKEQYYQQARELGVNFFLYTPDKKPKVIDEQQYFRVLFDGKVLGKEMEIRASHIVLSTGLRPDPGAEELAKTYKLTRNEDGFFMEAHVKLRPVDFASEGLFLAGLNHAPKNLEETISQALAAAARVGALLSHEALTVSGIIASHNRELCMSCLACLKACPFGAPFLDEDGKISHNPVKCTGCGICAGVCPAKAFQVHNFRDDQILAMINAAAT